MLVAPVNVNKPWVTYDWTVVQTHINKPYYQVRRYILSLSRHYTSVFGHFNKYTGAYHATCTIPTLMLKIHLFPCFIYTAS
jgi:hypothetical protein